MTERPSWVKDKKVAEDFEVIRVVPYNDLKDHDNDDACYILIRLYFDSYEIGVAICNYEHVILKEFRGRRPQDIYNGIFSYEKENDIKWFSNKQHIAYLGKELKKAEMALAAGTSYYQE